MASGVRARLRRWLAPPRTSGGLRWWWDHPAAGATVDGETLIIDGWLAGGPPGAEVVVSVGGVPLGATAARHARGDVASALSLDDDAVGVHLEVGLDPATPDSFRVSLAVRPEPEAPTRVLEERTLRRGAREPAPYEVLFRAAPAVLHREHVYASGPPVFEPVTEMLAIIRRHVGPAVLDVGCGVGAYGAALAVAGHAVTCVEWPEPLARTTASRGLRVARADAQCLPFRDGAFDSTIAVEVLEHLPRPEAAVSEWARVTRRNVIVSVPNAAVIPHLHAWGVVPWHLLEATHLSFFGAESLRALLAEAFPHVALGYYGRTFPFTHRPLYQHLFAVAAHERRWMLDVRQPVY